MSRLCRGCVAEDTSKPKAGGWGISIAVAIHFFDPTLQAATGTMP